MDLRSTTFASPLAAGESQAERTAKATRDGKRVDQAATDFEGLLVAQMLRYARQAGDGGWMGTGEDKSSESMIELAEESLARMMASKGCLGLASMMKQGVLAEAAPMTQPPEGPPSKPPPSR